MADLQSDFDFVMDAIIGQGKPAVSEIKSSIMTCEYRAPDGTMCAIGHMITDDEARRLSGLGVDDAFDQGLLPDRFCEERKFYADLQWAHDSAAFALRDGEDFLTAFRTRMRKVADDYCLLFAQEAP